MNLKLRILLLTSLIFVVSALAAGLAGRALIENIIAEWGVRFADQQVRYHKSKALQPILREVALARQLARSDAVRNWAADPENDALHRAAIRKLESFRQNFQDRSYFVTLVANGQYYYNNAANEFAGRELRYTLDPALDKDQWFYTLLRQEDELQINVGPDRALGVTNVWINVQIRDESGKRVLGIAGTGLNLDRFIGSYGDGNIAGVSSLLVDGSGAIQLHRNKALIDYASLTKPLAERKTFFMLLDSPSDRASIRNAMAELRGAQRSTAMLHVEFAGKPHLAGVTALPEIGWYEITLLDMEQLLPVSRFAGIAAIFLASLLAALVCLAVALNRLVLNPLAALRAAIGRVAAGNTAPVRLPVPISGEMRELMEHFTRMAHNVSASRLELEERVRERTAALERMTKVDALTGALNRRGMSEHLELAAARIRREKQGLGILWLDVDSFKQINDRHGHAAGDAALRAVADIVRQHLRPYDHLARWGCDEFLILLTPVDAASLDTIAERICMVVRSHRIDVGGDRPECLSVSIGGYLLSEGDDLDQLLERADRALYDAKAGGRNRYCRTVVERAANDPVVMGHRMGKEELNELR